MALLEMNRDDARTEDEKALLKNTLLLKKNKDELYKNASDVFGESTRSIKAKKSL